MKALFYFWLKGIRWLLFRLFLWESVVYFLQMQFPTRCFWHLILGRDKEDECWRLYVACASKGSPLSARRTAALLDGRNTITASFAHSHFSACKLTCFRAQLLTGVPAFAWTLVKTSMSTAMDTLLRIVVRQWLRKCPHTVRQSLQFSTG